MLINKIQSNYLNNNNYIKSNNSERVSRPAFPFFGCAIPRDKLKNLGYKYLTEIEGTRDEKSVYAIVKEYYYSKVLPLVAPKKGKVYEDNDLLHLFRHELVNQTGSPLELNINPEYKQMALEMAGFPKRVKYVSHQKKVFREIVGQINRLANRWGKIEDWKENPHKTVQFSELRKVLGSMNGIAETKGVNVIITDSIQD
jgi:hypothetical protein